MRRHFRVALLIGSLGSSAWACAPQTITVESPQPEGLRVVGRGEAYAAPDVATVRVGVEERARTAEQAMTQANRTMRAIIDAVRAQGVPAKDVQTSDLNVHFERDRNQPPMPLPEPPVQKSAVGSRGAEEAMVAQEQSARSAQLAPAAPPVDGHYVVRNTAVITFKDLDKVGAIIGAAMSSGANQLYGFQLSIQDPSDLQAQAREKAVEAALQKAEALAKRAGVKLGRIVAIHDAQGSSDVPQMSQRMALKQESAANDVPFERGELSVEQSVEVVFSLAQE